MSDPTMPPSSAVAYAASVIYFGCWDRTGHGFHDQRGRSLHPTRAECGPWGYGVDSIRGSGGNGSHVPQGDRFLTHKDGWTLLDVTDRTIDSRGNSHSAFLVPAPDLTEQDMIELAWAAFPRIAVRIGLPQAPLSASTAQAGEPKPYLCGCPSDDPRPCPLHDSDSADNAHADGAS